MIEVLTGLLVLITGYYAWQNQRMVDEMRKTRSAAVLPKLALQWHRVGPEHSLVRIASVGPGPALDVEAEVVFVPLAEDSPEIRKRVQTTLLTTGESVDLIPSDGPNGEMLSMGDLANQFDRIDMSGTTHDVTGAEHQVADSLPDLAATRKNVHAAVISWTQPEPERRLADAFAGAFEKKALPQILNALKELRPKQ